jgi:hypothetical protein
MNHNENLTQSTKSKFNGIISVSGTKELAAKAGTSVAIILLTYSVLITKLSFGSYGLIHSLPLTYFIGLSLLVACSVILWNDSEKNFGIITIQLIAFLAGLWLVPFIIEQVPSRTSYFCAGFVEYIVRQGTLNPEVAFYHNWPGFSILNAILVNVLGLTDFTKLMGLTPFFSNCLYFLALCLLRRFMCKQDLATAWWPMVWMFFIANYLGQDYFSPQGMAYFLFLIFVGLLLISQETDNYASGSTGRILQLLFFCSITITHALTSIIAVVAFFILGFRREKWLSSLFITVIVILISWTFYGAFAYFSGHISGMLNELFNLEMSIHQNVVRVGSTGDDQVDKISEIYTLILLILPTLGWLTTKKGLPKNVFTRLGIAPLFLPIFLSYNGEMIVRVLLFLLLPIAFFSTSFFRNKKALVSYGLIIFLVISIPLHILIRYGNEEYNYVSLGELDAANFLFGKAAHEFEIVTENDPILKQRDIERFAIVLTSTSTLKDGKIIGPWSKDKNDPQYVVLSRGTWVAYKRFMTDIGNSKLRKIQGVLQKSTNYELIYANKDSSIYNFREV